MLGNAAEGFVYVYIGFCTFTFTKFENNGESKYPWSPSFISVMIVILVVGRCLGIWIAHMLPKLCSKKKSVITASELGFISYGGLTRGAISFGLVLKIPDVGKNETGFFNERGLLITTTLACIIFTTIVFGSFMPVM